MAAPLCIGLRRGAGLLGEVVGAHRLLATTALGLGMAGLAIGYAAATGHGISDVLFSGQDQLPGLVADSAKYSVGALLLLLLCKGLAYTGALGAFRGGPTFPAMFLGAVGGIALSHLPGLSMVPALAMGVGAMTGAMLRLPMTAVLVVSLLLGSDGFPVIPLTIVAVVVAYVAENWLTPPSAAGSPAPGDDGEHREPDAARAPRWRDAGRVTAAGC